MVDCAGLGARRLAGDLDVRPVRGQVVLVEGVELDRWSLDSAGPTYVVPRSDQVVVGGTEQRGDWSRTPSPETADEILLRATRLVPELARARVVGHRVGLRPARPAVRLERPARGPGSALLRPRRRRRHAQLGVRGRGDAAGGDARADVSGPTSSGPLMRAMMRRMARDFTTIGVVGLGTMGAGIAEVFARHGYAVVGVEVDEDGRHPRSAAPRELHRPRRGAGQAQRGRAEGAARPGHLRHLAGGAQGGRPRRRGGGGVRSRSRSRSSRRSRTSSRPTRSSRPTPPRSRSPRSRPPTPARAGSSGCTSSTPRRCRASWRSCGRW